jgi:hypothetical protein
MMQGFLKLFKEIREELRGLKILYKSSVCGRLSSEKPLEDEREAIESSDELVGEDEIFRVLG